jgi:hypothetical protein
MLAAVIRISILVNSILTTRRRTLDRFSFFFMSNNRPIYLYFIDHFEFRFSNLLVWVVRNLKRWPFEARFPFVFHWKSGFIFHEIVLCVTLKRADAFSEFDLFDLRIRAVLMFSWKDHFSIDIFYQIEQFALPSKVLRFFSFSILALDKDAGAFVL